jgi:hypothetical protein
LRPSFEDLLPLQDADIIIGRVHQYAREDAIKCYLQKNKFVINLFRRESFVGVRLINYNPREGKSDDGESEIGRMGSAVVQGVGKALCWFGGKLTEMAFVY